MCCDTGSAQFCVKRCLRRTALKYCNVEKIALWLFFLCRCADLVVLVFLLTLFMFTRYAEQEEAVTGLYVNCL